MSLNMRKESDRVEERTDADTHFTKCKLLSRGVDMQPYGGKTYTKEP